MDKKPAQSKVVKPSKPVGKTRKVESLNSVGKKALAEAVGKTNLIQTKSTVGVKTAEEAILEMKTRL